MAKRKSSGSAKPAPIKYISAKDVQLTDASWERLFFNFSVKSSLKEDLSFSLARISFDRIDYLELDSYDGDKSDLSAKLMEEYPLNPYSVEDGVYYFRISMTTIGGGNFLNNGRWFLVTRFKDDSRLVFCSVTDEFSYKLCNLDKVCPYKKYKYVYTVHFVPDTFDSETIIPVMHSRFFIRNSNWMDMFALRDRQTLRGKLECIIRKAKNALLQMVYNLIERHTSKNGTSVLLMSETKPYLWGNLKYIDERIKARGLDKQFRIEYSFRNAVGKRNNAKSWFHTMRMLARQDFVFVDDFAPVFSYLKLSPRTKLIQVWHAGEGFKSVGYSRFGLPGSPHPSASSHRSYDYAVTGSKRLVEVYSEVFGIPEEKILPLGMARLDGFLNEDIISEKSAEFYTAHPECKGKKLILFCPTFRGASQKTGHYKYDMLDFDAIYDFCGDDYIWAFKMHPFVRNKVPLKEKYKDRIIDLTDSQNINDLYYVTDIMITDYSSAYYEYALLKRPVIFYTYDRTVYEVVRGVHKSIRETAPGKVCDTFDELLQALKTKDYEIEKTIRFSEENFGEYDGKASDRIIDTILLGK